MQKLILVIICFISYIESFAQITPINSDRPGRTNTAFTTPHKWLQTEMGFQKQTEKYKPFTYKDTYLQIPSLLLKYGLNDRTELRLISALVYQNLGAVNLNEVASGLSNTQLGGKFNFLNQKGILPKTSIIAHYRLNALNSSIVGKDTINGGNISLAMLNTISENFLIGYNIGVEKITWQYDAMYFYSLSPKFNFAEKWQAFVEIYGNLWKGRNAQTTIDGGVSYYINDDFKIDASAGTRINKNTNLKFYSVGGSFRFKTSNKN